MASRSLILLLVACRRDTLLQLPAGVPVLARLQARDAYGNARGVGGDDVRATLTSTQGGGTLTAPLAVVDMGDGLYNVSWVRERIGACLGCEAHGGNVPSCTYSERPNTKDSSHLCSTIY